MPTRLLIAAAVLVCPLAALAANTAAPKTMRKAPAIYDRGDGIYQDATSGSVLAVENGQSAKVIGVGMRDTFAYGAGKGITQLDQSNGGTCVGNTTTVPCLATFGQGDTLVWFPIVTATLTLSVVSTGLDIAGDQTDNDGNEVAGGVLGASGRPFVVGADPAFYFCANVKLADVSGSDLFMTGFRKAEPFNAAFASYTNLAAIGSVSGEIYTKTNLASGGVVSTDTTGTWADAATHKLCTYVSDAGAVTYKVDNVAPVTTVAYSFASGTPVIPFVHLLHDSDIMDSAVISLWEAGYQQ